MGPALASIWEPRWAALVALQATAQPAGLPGLPGRMAPAAAAAMAAAVPAARVDPVANCWRGTPRTAQAAVAAVTVALVAPAVSTAAGGGGGYPSGQGRAGCQGLIVLAWGGSVHVPPPTPAVLSDLVRQTLCAGEGVLLTSDLVRMVLRSSGTGAGTFLVVDDIIVQTLRSTASPSVSRGGPMTSIIM